MKQALTFAFLAGLSFQLSAEIVFSNDFEDSDTTPEIGTWTFANDPTLEAIPTSSDAADETLGENVGLIDQGGVLDLTLGLTSAVSLSEGDVVQVDFDFSARRTAGNSRTIFLDALDSNGDIVVRLVLGDTNALGNGGNDRQRPGYDPSSEGAVNTENSIFPNPNSPGSFWWGSDFDIESFDVLRDAHVSLSISASTFDITTTNQGGVEYSATELPNRDDGTFANITSFQLTSAGENYGFFIDNLIVEGVETFVTVPGPIQIIQQEFEAESRNFRVTFSSIPGVVYQPSVSEDLLSWTLLNTIVADSTETEFVELNIPESATRRFYQFSVATDIEAE